MYSSTFGKGGWVGAVCTFWYECMSFGSFSLQELTCMHCVLACKSLHVCTVCIWRCEHARFCVEVFLCAIYTFSFIHSFICHGKMPCVSTVAQGMFCGAKYTYHTFTPIIKHH